ncbi:TlpA disulfide reductase family protein [Agriterribacter sp.]|uniref:TlpA disulfide reductase family protein n=1 Tax=Agriterribacter sp. TaxID=2821509 RepID=UPI002C29CA64|nr:TlpA disulfide reductase family protein [Agriterribacter sp.]HRP56797.1 TlpA disulfide reductase family protein [Agriterribacter sp.]
MQKLFVALMFSVILSSCADKGKSPGDTSYLLTGNIAGLDSGWAYLYHPEKEQEIPDSAKIVNAGFEFKGNAAYPEFVLLGYDQNGQKKFPLGFFLENGKITINGSVDSLYKADINGSDSQEELKKFNEQRKPIEEKQKQLYDQYQMAAMQGDAQKAGEIQKQYEALEGESKTLVAKFVKENPASYVSAFQLAQTLGYDIEPADIEPLYNGLDENVKASYFGKAVKKSLDAAKSTAIGSIAPDFTLNDINGKPVSLAAYRGKYTLVDFWASWCGPCRQENPTVVKAYDTYKSKGFDILGVSLDEKKDKWEQAIRQDKLTWTHVSDLKGWESDAAALYGIKAIPMNYLLDKEGKIIAKSLRGEDLIKKLGEILN